MTRTEAMRFRAQLEALGETMPDETLVAIPALAHRWLPNGHYTVGYRVQYDGCLYKCRTEHDAINDPNRAPDLAASLWELIAPPSEDGSREHPISFASGMALENGKYYTQYDVLYLCIRDSGVPLYNDLRDLVGNYVEVVS